MCSRPPVSVVSGSIPVMPHPSVEQVSVALRASWSADTCDPVDLPWSPANPSRGQCGTTALVIHDLLGGELMFAEVLRQDGSSQGHHYWNRMPDGREIDLTLEQFAPDEILQPGHVVTRPPGAPRRCAEQYTTLSRRVRERLQ